MHHVENNFLTTNQENDMAMVDRMSHVLWQAICQHDCRQWSREL